MKSNDWELVATLKFNKELLTSGFWSQSKKIFRHQVVGQTIEFYQQIESFNYKFCYDYPISYSVPQSTLRVYRKLVLPLCSI